MKSNATTYRIEGELRDWIRDKAFAENISQTTLVKEILDSYRKGQTVNRIISTAALTAEEKLRKAEEKKRNNLRFKENMFMMSLINSAYGLYREGDLKAAELQLLKSLWALREISASRNAA